jgi:hypothetical protein
MTKDLINGIATIAIGLFVFFYSMTYSKGGLSVAENPAIYPQMLAGIAVMLGAVLLLRTGKNRKAAVSADGDAKKEMVPEGRPRVLKIAAALICFVVGIRFIGFIVPSLIFCFVTPLILGTSKKTAAIVSASLTVVIYILFFIFFKVPIPHGIFFG